MKNFILLAFTLIMLTPTFSQQKYTTNKKKAITAFETALQHYNRYDYQKTILYLEEALNHDDEFIEAYIVMGDNYLDMKAFDKAHQAYKKAIKIDPDFYPRVYFMAAQAVLKQGNYKLGKDYLSTFLNYKSINPVNRKKADELLKTCNFAIPQIENPVPFDPQNLGGDVNSKFAEYLPALTADEQTLIITVRKPIGGISANFGNYEQEDFYISKKLDGKWTKAMPLGPPLNTEGNEGAQAVSPDGSFFVFTACNRPDGFGSCDLYYSESVGGKWKKPKNMGEKVNSSSWDSQPSIASDGKTLFFTSSRPGGKGSMDIYKTVMDEYGEWTKPVNIGDSINTEGAETSPFIHPDNKTLYFSSDGHIGMGGMDIFYCRKDSNGNWNKPVNIGYPINTFGDENSLILNTRGDMAYFASDKLEGFGKQDLYKFKLYEEARPNPVSYMKGIVYDDQTKKRLDAKFELISLKDGKTKVESKSDPVNGEFLVCLPTGNQYALNVSKKGYLFYSENFSMPAEIHQKIDPFLKNVPLKPIKVGESVVLKNIFFEFDKYNLKKESRVELNKLFNLLKENKTLKIEIGGHTDNKGSEEYNKTLSQDRAKAVYDYLTSKGISSERLSYKGYGESKPIDTNKTEEGRANNRRTEFKVIDN